MADLVFKLKTLTPIWTGGIDKDDRKLHLTGIKGSLRWWYEALLRGLDKYACDPRSDDSCRVESKGINHNFPVPDQVKKIICPACYLFGCTGWSSKFVLRMVQPSSNIVVISLNAEDKNEIPFDIYFVEKKQFEIGEELLLKMMLRLIVDYGAIGGKTVLKPSDEDYKNVLSYPKKNHLDYGIIARRVEKNGIDESNVPTSKINTSTTINDYLKAFPKSGTDNHLEWPALDNFLFVRDGYIHRRMHNDIVNRDSMNPKKYLQSAGDLNKWIGGHEPTGGDDKAISKKMFSFHGIKPSALVKKDERLPADDSRIDLFVRRSFGYSKMGQFDDFQTLVKQKFTVSISLGKEVLDDL